MEITVAYLGGSRGQTGCGRETLQLSADATVADARRQIADRHPTLAPWLDTVRWAVNFEFVEESQPLAAQDELAVIPPVAGGAARARISSAPLDPDSLQKQLADPGVGVLGV